MVNKVQVILVVLTVYLHFTQAVVQFSFNRGDFAISEGGNLPSQLSIIKTGQHEMNISFQVRVIQGTARDNIDYRSNSGDLYVFTSNTSQLRIRTQLLGDRAGESVEDFMICLPDSQTLQLMGAVVVEPTCVTITIVDDDSVVIGFKNSFEAVMEGGVSSICVEVKPEGLRLDPFDNVPLTIRTDPGSEVVLSTNSLTFAMTNEICITVSVADRNATFTGSRSYQLILESSGGSTVPVEIYPRAIPIIVIDDDGPDANFSIVSPQSTFTVQEGDRIDNIRVQKFGTTLLSYRVSLMVTALRGSSDTNDIAISNSLLFSPSTTTMDVGAIEIVNNSLPEGTKEFRISIGGIEAVGVPGVPTTVLGDSINITVYDNDFKVGFNISNITLVEGRNDTVCVGTLDLEPSDIYPARNISLLISTNDTTFESGNLELSVNEVLLNNENEYTGCFIVAFPDDNNECDRKHARNFIIQLSWIRPNNPDHNIYIERKNLDVTIIDEQKDCLTTASGSNRTAAIVVPIVVIILALGLVITFLVLAVVARRCGFRIPFINKPESVQLEDLENSEESSSSSQSQSGSIEKKEEIEPTEKTMAIASPDDGNGDTPMEQTNDLTKFNSGRSDKGEVKDTGTPVDDYENVYDNNDNINPNSQPVGLKADVITQDSASTGVKT